LAVGGGDEAILHSNRALCFCQLGRHEEGLEDAKLCVALRPDFFKGYVRGAKALRALGRPEEALAFLKKCPKNTEAGALASELRPEAEAAETVRISSLSGAERAKEEGNVLFRKGLFEQALEKYSEALQGCDDQESIMALAIRNNRAACYHQVSDHSSAVRDTSYVLKREPSNFKALFRRMLALEPLERYEAALDDARALLRQDPRNEVANKMQHRLGKLVRDLHRADGH
jgi:tetratricopeptide (TPR) repeat protein